MSLCLTVNVAHTARYWIRRTGALPRTTDARGEATMIDVLGRQNYRRHLSPTERYQPQWRARPSVLTHSFASRFCDGERFFGAAVLYKDGFGAGGPLEGLWVLVSMLDPLVNRGLEFGDVVEGSSPDALASDFGEEPLDEVEPGTGCRGEVQCEAFVSHQPPFHGRRLVGGVVVEDQMQIEMCGRLAVDCFQKRQELVCPMACQTFADDGTGRHIERGEECCGAVALVIMGHRAGTALFQGQTRLRAVECLDLALLIDGKHQRLLRRIDVKADDVLDLRDEVGIVGDLEAAHEMRLEAVFGPDALHARVADAHFFRHRSHAPVRGIGGTLLHGLLDDLELHGSTERLSARRLGAAFDQTIDAGLGKIVLPAPDGGLRNPDLTHNRHDAMTVRRHQHDPRSLGDLLSRVSIGDQLLQFPASLAIKYNQVVSHAASESYSRQVGIQMSVTEH